MPIVTLCLGLILIALGGVTRAMSDSPSFTVWIPAIIGSLFLVLGLVARRQAARKHAMHGAALLALAAIGGSAGGLAGLPALLSGGEVERPLAVIARSLTALLCAGFLVLAIRSFVVARLARRNAAVTGG